MPNDHELRFAADDYQSPENRDFTTDAIHGGYHGTSSAVPIYQGNTNYREGYEGTNSYGRGLDKAGGPTNGALEEQVKILEGAEWSQSTSCGMAAIGQTLFGLLKSGDRVVGHETVYAGAQMFFKEVLPVKWGVDVEQVNMCDLAALETALEKPTRMVYFEPYAHSMEFIDLARAIEIAHEAGALAVVDNTFLSPYLLRPLQFGADVVLHAMTKYMAGHGDALAGIVSGRDEEIRAQIHYMRILMGGVLAPMNAFLVHRGLKTLAFRMERHCSGAQKVAEYLERHEKVGQVNFLGLASHPNHEIATGYLRGFGGMMRFISRPGVSLDAFIGGLKMCKPWYSLGDVETLVLPSGGDAENGFGARVSVGLEDADDIIADLEQALEKA